MRHLSGWPTSCTRRSWATWCWPPPSTTSPAVRLLPTCQLAPLAPGPSLPRPPWAWDPGTRAWCASTATPTGYRSTATRGSSRSSSTWGRRPMKASPEASSAAEVEQGQSALLTRRRSRVRLLEWTIFLCYTSRGSTLCLSFFSRTFSKSQTCILSSNLFSDELFGCTKF